MIDLINQNLPIPEFEEKLNKLENAAIISLKQNDLAIFLSSTSVAKYSTKLWYPEDMGGENAFKYIVSNSLNNKVKPRWINWGKVIGADAIGILTGATNSVLASGGASAIPNPALGGVPTAGAIGLVTGAGASAVSAWSQL